ncbi:hypothetical protein ACHAWF_015577 [Thalassiosira exigua]
MKLLLTIAFTTLGASAQANKLRGTNTDIAVLSHSAESIDSFENTFRMQKESGYAKKAPTLPQVDAARLFNILTNNNDLIVGDLPENIPYTMPQNVQICRDSFATKERSPDFLTNYPPELPETSSKDGFFHYKQYKEDSVYGKTLQKVVNRTDVLLEELYQAGLISAIQIPSLMFDVDNTMAYTAIKDVDFSGDAPPVTATVNFIKKWCEGWGSGDRANLKCVFISARFCTELNARATVTWLQNTYDVDEDFISENVQFSGNLDCSCCSRGDPGMADNFRRANIAYKDILRKDWIDRQGVTWVASIGDMLTDSVGHYSGIRIKLPNFWFDSSIVPNQFTQGAHPPLNADGLVPPEQWAEYCPVNTQAPITPSEHCLTEEALQIAREHASLDYCLAQTVERAPNQEEGCNVDISTGEVTCPK